MQTQAERQFNEDYAVLRQLYFTCKIKQGKALMFLWINQKGLETAKLAEKEVSSKYIRKLFTQPHFEKDCLKMFEEE